MPVMGRFAAAAISVLLCIASSCASPAAPAIAVYSCVMDGEATFWQWTADESAISGSVTSVWQDGKPPNRELSSRVSEISGTVRDGAVAIAVEGRPPMLGSVSPAGLTLGLPAADGTVATATCTESDVASWNRYLSEMQAAIDADNAAEAERLDAVARDEQIRSLRSSLEVARSSVAQETLDLEADATLTEALADVRSAVDDAEIAGANIGLRETCNLGDIEVAAGQVEVLAGRVEMLAGVLESVGNARESRIDRFRDGAEAMLDDAATLRELGEQPSFDVESAAASADAVATRMSRDVDAADLEADDLIARAADYAKVARDRATALCG